jgi:hypothetical protein
VWLLKTELVRHQMIRNNIGIAYPAISEGTCLDLVLPVTRKGLASLSVSAKKLAAAQADFDAAQQIFLSQVHKLDCPATSADATLRQFPNVIEGCEPGSVSNAA